MAWRLFEQIEEIVGECGSFLCIRENTVHFVHQSAQDFFLESENYYKLSHFNKEESHLNMFRQSLKALKNLYRNMYNIPSPGDIIDAPDPDPLACLGYVSSYWARHLIAGGGLLKTADSRWGGNLPQPLEHFDKSLKSLVKDACRFVLTFRHAFELAPLQVYVSALIFSPTSSVVKGLYQTDQPAWINLNSEPPSDWDTCTQILEGKNTLFDAIALAPDGHTLASLSDNQLKLWDTEKGCCIYCCEWKTSYFDRLAFSPNGKQLAALDRNDRTICRIVLLNLIVPSVNSDKPFLNLDSNPDFEDIEDFNATAIVFSPSGLRLAASSTNASAKIWDPSTRCCVRTMTRPSFPDDKLSCIAYSDDGTMLATGRRRDGVRIWVVETGQCLHAVDTPAEGLAFSLPQTLLVTKWDGGFSEWNTETWVNINPDLGRAW
uniref:Uncharacterized protein n=1 Tax=Bionectria ochroleuca TaxID=29856 RepID=A0A0B7K7Z8_BIOOC